MDVTVNRRVRSLAGHEEGSLLAFLREGLGLKGAKPGCGEGACGACTVLVQGRPVRACVTPAAAAAGASVLTVEGLAEEGLLHGVQEAFLEVRAFQCGYCTPGMVMAAVALLEQVEHPGDSEIALALDGNLCRCCTYPRIIRAVRRAAEAPGAARPAETAVQRELPRPARPWNAVAPAERDYFELLGDGLVVVARRPKSEEWSTSTEAWLHVGPGGAVTVFTGKVEVGQGSTDALAAVVAGELELPVAGVSVICGDTDVCPYDHGTFGSRTTPDVVPLVESAAAAARRVLLELGGDLTGVRRLEIAEGGRAPGKAAGPAGRRFGPAIVTGAQVFPSDVERPGVVTVRVSREPATPLELSEADLVDYLRAHPAEPEGWEGAIEEVRGDVDRALADAHVRLEATYTTAYLAHAPLESRAALAEWQDGELTVWTGTQRPFGVRGLLAEALAVPEERIRVIAPTAGGAFGGKHTGDVALEAARLALEQRRPVRVHWSREEEFRHGYLRPAAVIDVRAGLHPDGTISAWDFLDVNAGAAGLPVPYRVENCRLRFQPAESPLRQSSYRALAASANNFARESHIDELAALAGADPVEFRLRNLDDERLAAVVTAAAEGAGWNGRTAALGIASGVEKGSRIATCAQFEDGRVTRIVSAFDCGAVIDRDNLVNQIEGATVMGLGAALFERIRFDGNTITNASLTAYRVPRFTDVPRIEVVLVDRPDQPSVGAGETPIIAVAPAISAAIYAATGHRSRTLPLERGG